MNETNRTLNGTRHAEFVAIAGILSKNPIKILNEADLYVTVEPCVMCASMLRQYGIRSVYFGCWNERFGGTGGVLNIHSEYVTCSVSSDCSNRPQSQRRQALSSHWRHLSRRGHHVVEEVLRPGEREGSRAKAEEDQGTED